MKSGWIGEGGKACEEELRDFREGRKKKRKSVLGLNFLGGKCAASKRASGITSKKLRKRAEHGGAERIKFLGSRVLRLWIARR